MILMDGGEEAMNCSVSCFDSSLADLRTGFHTATVIGVYRKCFHLLMDDGRLITVFGKIKQQMPMSLRTDVPGEEPFGLLPLVEGQRACLERGFLTVPDGCFFCMLGGKEVDLHRPSLPLPKCIDLFQDTLVRFGKQRGEGRWLNTWCEHISRNTVLPEQAKLLNRIDGLMEALDSNDSIAIREGLMNTVGMGIGLTPSADDLICGLAAAAWLYWPEKNKQLFLNLLRGFCQEQGQNRTTLVSCQQLLLTAQGILSDPVFDLANALSLGRVDVMDSLTEEVIGYGSSSGTELCMGFLAGLRMAAGYCESERKNQW